MSGFRHSRSRFGLAVRACGLECARAARSLVYVLCFMLERGVQIPALLSCFRPSSGFMSGFRHSRSRFGLAVRACGLECAQAVRSLVYVLCFMLERGVRIPALLSCFRPSSGFVSGFGHSRSRFGLAVGACGLECARAARSLVYVLCFMLKRGVQIPALLSCFRPSSGFVSGFRHSRSRFGLAVGACGLECARAVRSLVYVLCFMLERGVQIPALLSCFRPSSGFVSGFRHSRSRFGLAVGACSLECARAVRSLVYVLCFMLERGVQIPALLSCFRPSSGFVSGFRHSRSRFGLAVGACSLECARAVRSLVYVLCFMLEHGVQIPALLSCFRPSSGFVSGFRHSRSRFGLAVKACGLECARAVRSLVYVLCFMLERGVQIPALLSCFRPSSGFMCGFRHSRSRFGLAVGACGLECAQAVRSLVYVLCFMLKCGVQIPALLSCFRPSSGFVSGSDTHAPGLVLLWEHAVSSVLEPYALLSTCSVSCWSVVFRSRHSCLVSGPVLGSCLGSDTHAPGLVLL